MTGSYFTWCTGVVMIRGRKYFCPSGLSPNFHSSLPGTLNIYIYTVNMVRKVLWSKTHSGMYSRQTSERHLYSTSVVNCRCHFRLGLHRIWQRQNTIPVGVWRFLSHCLILIFANMGHKDIPVIY